MPSSFIFEIPCSVIPCNLKSSKLELSASISIIVKASLLLYCFVLYAFKINLSAIAPENLVSPVPTSEYLIVGVDKLLSSITEPLDINLTLIFGYLKLAPFNLK